MNAVQQLLTDHIDIWTAAETEKKSGRGRASGSAGGVYGIKKLRELILELAVRGKLVSQDARDEPAGELLKRIQNSRGKLLAEGKIKKNKLHSPITEKDKPFGVPKGWEWVRLGDVLEMQNGRAFKPTDWVAKGLPIVRIQNLNNTQAPFNYCDEKCVDDRHVINNDSFLISWSGTPGTSFGAFIWRGGKAALNQHIFSCFQIGQPYFDEFLELAINTRLEELIAKAHGGVGLQHVTKGKLEALTLVLPSISEQHRIMTKVDELMTLCDQLEAHHSDATDAHEQLVSHMLGTLTQSQSAADFNANWQRIAAHFDTLFTTEAGIDALKQTLLQLAVMGKLVTQDASDEPASELLKQIQAEKEKLFAAGKIKKNKIFTPNTEQENPYSIPKNWKWATIDEISQVGTGATPLRTTYEYFNPPSINWVTSGETSNSFIVETEQYVSPLAIKETNLTIYSKGTLIVAMYGQGKTRGQISELMIDACTNQACSAIQLYCKDVHHRKYVKLFFEKIYDEIRELAAGGAQPNLNLGKIKETLLPLPPLSEQHRIVKKIDELMNMCNQLRSSISSANLQQHKVADVLVKHAVVE